MVCAVGRKRGGRWPRAVGLLAVWLGWSLTGCGTGSGPSEAAPDERPHLIVVSIDTLNRSALPAYSESAGALPAFDRLASECRVYDSAFAVAPWTLPSHASAFTGVYPVRHGAIDKDSRISDETPLAAEALAERGYQTVAFTGGGFVSASYGFDRGFERYDRSGFGSGAFRFPWEGGEKSDRVRPSLRRGEAFLADRDDPRPLFLFVHTYRVHDYFKARSWTRARAGLELPEQTDYVRCLWGKRECSRQEWSWLERLYRAEVEWVDRELQRLLDRVDSALDDRPTYLFLLSDHGEGFAPGRGRIHHGGRLDPDLVHVPLFACGDRFAPGRSDAVVGLIDLHPTLLKLAGIAPPEVDGRALTEARPGPRRMVAEERRHRWEDGVRLDFDGGEGKTQLAAVIDGRSWFVRHRVEDSRLYLRDGADAWRPVPAAERAEKVPAGFRRLTDALMSSTVRRNRVRADPELEEQLRSLGYIQ